MPLLSGSFTATATDGAVLVYTGAAAINSLQIVCSSIGTATVATFTVFDNTTATSVTNANAAQTWSSKSPGYSGQGPGTSRIQANFLQTARTGDQQGQTSPNAATAAPSWTGPNYWNITLATGEPNTAVTPVDKATVAALTITGVGSDSYNQLNNTSATGNVVAAVTAARALYIVTLAAGQSGTFLPATIAGVSFGINIRAQATGGTGISASYNLDYQPLP
jgi:hypothetical protein